MASVYALAADLFFAERLERALRDLGHKPEVRDLSAGGSGQAPGNAAITQVSLPGGVDLAIVDLEAGEAALALVRAARERGIPVLAFGAHVDVEARRAAEGLGARVVTKSRLTRSFTDLVAAMLGPSV
ncbi:hypothetical protein [Symbiobacterium thermophilum]|uniref:Response regulatory domain-containing protein n=1 Tax=Symbiobacterium thermophilum (strain DSM 24528 / JCM 14929 / IAM 14863 / T) TaxID=292459 RepID=Q67KM4_SYMTH|nr:hypothetical protein [Symbiobacterium thermophilum]BAD41774.1 hypothetical protein STH2789 [Symbiobacterium thermophilum IAM 14863]